jgi:GTPase SAR1 family protein
MNQIQPPVIILVIGVVGAGKSTFVSRATGNSNVQIGHGMHSSNFHLLQNTLQQLINETGTQHPTIFPFLLDGREVCLIDTPGFDDDTRPDSAILEEISLFLAELSKWNRNPTGIIYLQDITSNRVTGSEKFRTRMCEDICGKHGLKNLVIATTRWEQIAHRPSVGFERLKQRREDEAFWKFMQDNGAQVVTHHDTEESARNIVRMFLPKQPVQFQLVDELISYDGQVAKTSAGRRVCGKLEMKQAEKVETLVALKEKQQHTAAVEQELKKLDQEEIEFKKKKARTFSRHMCPWNSADFLNRFPLVEKSGSMFPAGCK